MISRPVAVFAVVSSATIGSMIYAHLSQKWDIAAMHDDDVRKYVRDIPLGATPPLPPGFTAPF